MLELEVERVYRFVTRHMSKQSWKKMFILCEWIFFLGNLDHFSVPYFYGKSLTLKTKLKWHKTQMFRWNRILYVHKLSCFISYSQDSATFFLKCRIFNMHLNWLEPTKTFWKCSLCVTQRKIKYPLTHFTRVEFQNWLNCVNTFAHHSK